MPSRKIWKAIGIVPITRQQAVTIEQIKVVGQMVKSVGGFGCFQEALDVVRQIGGLKRLRASWVQCP